MNKPTVLKVAVAAALIGLAGYWYWSPFLALHQMREAAKSSDAEAFNEHVDYPRLRESLKRQLAAAIEGRAGQSAQSDSPLGKSGAALGSMLALAVVDRMVDTFVQPTAVMRVMQEGKLLPNPKEDRPSGEPQAPGEGADAGAGRSDPVWSTERRGVNEFLLHLRKADQPDDRRTSLVFERRGFANWQLTEIRIAPI
ncbi:DUF2939 domain-containing protein [Roseateles amylovorans]|uniref:DUF2939 domain-containing protein n=1 Tax=Roseateles amylovorans TaxID=2978473 RepID=A0ABY6B1X8_9BURK|nr:DUF2939 domain-containing protein [Roseateles amylovorans]UXH79075.1 DUF2939 domain-containing protein [Roseateles amylovorans]